MRSLISLLKERVLVSDGAYGTMLHEMGLPPNLLPEVWNLEMSEKITMLHKFYIEFGADLITTNTFNANPFRLRHFGLINELETLIAAAVSCAVKARKDAGADIYIAGSVGPSGEFLKPFGELEFDEALLGYRRVFRAFERSEVDAVTIETITDLQELRAILIAASEEFSRDIIAQMSFNGDQTVTGTKPETFACVASAMGADIIGINCGTTPEAYLDILPKIRKSTSRPVIVQPNAGIPYHLNGEVLHPENPEALAVIAQRFYSAGANIIGSCCGSTPEHTKRIAEQIKWKRPVQQDFIRATVFTDRISTVRAGKGLPFVSIGEKINTSTNSRLRKGLLKGDLSALKMEVFEQFQNGADALDINLNTVLKKTGNEFLKDILYGIQNTAHIPIFLDSPDPAIFEEGLKYISGKPVINSVYLSKKLLERVIPLVKTFGTAVVGLAMDKKDISFKPKDRFRIAMKLIELLVSEGIPKEDIIIDPIVTTISTNDQAAIASLKTLELLRKEGITTIMGISNISFGLPNRAMLNSSFLEQAIESGLSMGIYNTSGKRKHQGYQIAGELLKGNDPGCKNFIGAATDISPDIEINDEEVLPPDERVHRDIIYGLDEQLLDDIKDLMDTGKSALAIINDHLLPAIAHVGDEFQKGNFFLPQVISSAKAMQEASRILHPHLVDGDNPSSGKKILMATVKDDVHDIGKNLVKVILQGYGFDVVDAGKDVHPEEILRVFKKEKCDFIGLSVLMTTTLDNLAGTVKYLRDNDVEVPILIGGAVVNKMMADKLGCIYCRDGIEAVKYLQGLK